MRNLSQSKGGYRGMADTRRHFLAKKNKQAAPKRHPPRLKGRAGVGLIRQQKFPPGAAKTYLKSEIINRKSKMNCPVGHLGYWKKPEHARKMDAIES